MQIQIPYKEVKTDDSNEVTILSNCNNIFQLELILLPPKGFNLTLFAYFYSLRLCNCMFSSKEIHISALKIAYLCGRGLIPVMAVSGKAGSCLPLVGSLQYRTLANYMYWFPLPFQLPVVI